MQKVQELDIQRINEMKTIYQVIEDNAGSLYIFIFGTIGTVVRGFENFEYLSHEDFMENIRALDAGDDASDWDGAYENPQGVYYNITSSLHGWKLVADQSGNYPDAMGRAGQIAFGVDSV